MEYKVLNNGLRMPMVGLGVYNISERALRYTDGTGIIGRFQLFFHQIHQNTKLL